MFLPVRDFKKNFVVLSSNPQTCFGKPTSKHLAVYLEAQKQARFHCIAWIFEVGFGLQKRSFFVFSECMGDFIKQNYFSSLGLMT